MSFASQLGHVGFRTQTAKGTFVNPSAGGVFMRTRSGSIGGVRELLIPDPEIGGNRDVSDAYLGPVAFAGEYEFYARMEALATLLQAGLGGASSDSALGGGAHSHEIEAADAALPWLSVEEKVADGYEAWRFTDVKVQTLHLEAEATGFLMGTVGLVGLTQLAIGASATADPDYDTTPMIVGSNVVLSFGGVQLPAKSFSFDLNNNVEDDDFRLGSLFLGDAGEKRREVTFGATIRPDDGALFRQAVYGTPGATGPGGEVTKDDVTLVCQSYEAITGAILFEVSFDLPQAVIAPFEVNPSGDDILEHDIEIRALRPDPDFPILTATVVNGLAAVA